MATILLAWNPSRYPGSLLDELRAARRNRKPGFSWSVGNRKRVQPGDRAFLIRLVEVPKGIVAVGWITSSPREEEHWDPDLAREGKRSWYVDLDLEYLSLEPVVPWSVLRSGKLSRGHWSPQRSGIAIAPDIATALEREWARRVPSVGSKPTDGSIESFYEGRLKEVRLTKPERNPRARAACLHHYGSQCLCCGMTFERVYGEDAARLVVVHHLKPLGAAHGQREVDPVQDLRPVCPNCHAVIHLTNPPLSIDAVRSRLRRRKRLR